MGTVVDVKVRLGLVLGIVWPLPAICAALLSGRMSFFERIRAAVLAILGGIFLAMVIVGSSYLTWRSWGGYVYIIGGVGYIAGLWEFLSNPAGRYR